MSNIFSEEFDDIVGVAYKNFNLKKKVLSLFADKGNIRLAELSKDLGLSVPKVTSLVNDLIQEGLVADFGKDDSSGGRPPNLYGLKADSVYFVGIDVKYDYINCAVSDFQENLIEVKENIPYLLENTEDSLQRLCTLTNEFINTSPVPKDKIQGICINLSGRVNYKSGYSYSFFHFQEDPLSKSMEEAVGIRVFLENDSKAMAYGEFCSGVVKNEKDVLFLNLDYGIGMGIVIDGELYYGKSGYSGEFGHIPIFDNNIICQCGKKGCLETEASGWALVKKFKEKITSGHTSIVFEHKNTNEIILEDVIQAAINDDVLAIELIAEIGEKLGRGVALLINIFNPELVILGGGLAETGDYIRLPIKSAVNKFSLSLVNNDTELKISKLSNLSGVLGACLLVRKRLLSVS